MLQNRRMFVKAIANLAVASFIGSHPAVAAKAAKPLAIACNQYPWFTFLQRQGRNWSADLDNSLREFTQSGLTGYEPIIEAAKDISLLAPLLKKYNLQMRSLYVNSVLHKPEEIEKSIYSVVAIAEAATAVGTQIIVTNPSPIRWGGPEDKDDKQLELQAAALGKLGKELRKRDILLAYHTHDPEMRNAAREFHHMMLHTDPKDVSLCLDAHWIYRGSGNSQVALFDIVRLYGKRISELHLRQSKAGIWTEVFGEGDIDYKRLVKALQTLKVRPHVVLEQAVEKGSPNTLTAIEAHRQSLTYANDLFAGFAN
ncbi:sugar phosphate isomerase/epimerase [Rhodocytophaga aerolata]|uniref:Sugar phosphate isomerase/epimerase n=2 Tax=Rhodocytophaga aerolata TaxID=455078 RepID=A0ABT8QYS0_9BACT|nr:sugar phosphate isomerase/epimerase [Rhodocytophaga aerolata]MDO1444991.1 sugar phosphate isomerase/epimerase [Rhodocytophaga aerolata]